MQQRQSRPEPFERIDLDEAKNRMESGDVAVIDVRELNEWNAGHLPGAKHIPLNTVLNRISEFPTDKQVLLVCGTQNRSALAAEMAAAMGLTNLAVIEGGTEGWKRRGFPVEY
jgi:hydroxyacylglutathione hydrolase